MSAARAPGRGRLDPERWLASAAGRIGLVLVLVALATAVTSAQRYEFITGRPGAEVEIVPLVARQFVSWLAWAGIGAVALRIASASFERTQSLALAVALQVPLSLAVASGMVYFDSWLAAQARPNRGRFERGFERGFDSPRRMLTFRLPSNLFIYWVVLGLGAGAQVYRRTRREERRAAELELRAAKLDAELSDAQMASLRAQLHPHFLFNALHTVGGLVREGRDEHALKTLSAIGELLRTTLDQGEEHELRFADELRVARRYLEIERMRFGHRLQVEWQVEDGCDDALVPALFLLPLVENAVRHGIAPRTSGGKIRIAARRADARLEVEVADDGPGFPPAVLAGTESGQLPPHSAESAAQRRTPQNVEEVVLTPSRPARRCIGLANDRARLAMLYGAEQGFELENPPGGGARVRVSLPFRVGAEMADDG